MGVTSFKKYSSGVSSNGGRSACMIRFAFSGYRAQERASEVPFPRSSETPKPVRCSSHELFEQAVKPALAPNVSIAFSKVRLAIFMSVCTQFLRAETNPHPGLNSLFCAEIGRVRLDFPVRSELLITSIAILGTLVSAGDLFALPHLKGTSCPRDRPGLSSRGQCVDWWSRIALSGKVR